LALHSPDETGNTFMHHILQLTFGGDEWIAWCVSQGCLEYAWFDNHQQFTLFSANVRVKRRTKSNVAAKNAARANHIRQHLPLVIPVPPLVAIILDHLDQLLL
jgi:hypothetical protein